MSTSAIPHPPGFRVVDSTPASVRRLNFDELQITASSGTTMDPVATDVNYALLASDQEGNQRGGPTGVFIWVDDQSIIELKTSSFHTTRTGWAFLTPGAGVNGNALPSAVDGALRSYITGRLMTLRNHPGS